jgi:hypothetical protein
VKILHQRETFGNKNDVAAGDGTHANNTPSGAFKECPAKACCYLLIEKGS